MFTRSISVMLTRIVLTNVAIVLTKVAEVLTKVARLTGVKSVNIKLHKVTIEKGLFIKSFSFSVYTKLRPSSPLSR